MEISESNRNRAVVFKEFGDPEKVMHLAHLPKPHICPGHVLVRVLLRPVNPMELFICSDAEIAHMFMDFTSNPSILETSGIVAGSEGGVGIVEEVGEDVTGISPGQRVHLDTTFPYFLGSFQGSWQDYMLVKEEHAIPVPETIEDAIAAQFSSNPWTVYGLCRDIATVCPKEEYILITAAGSTVGRLFIQLAKHQGYKVIGVVRREELKDELISLGASAVINTVHEDVAKEVKQITDGRGAYLGIDLVGGTLTKCVGASVMRDGQVWVAGELGSLDIVFSQKDMWRNVRFSIWDASPYFMEKEKKEAAIEACWKLFGEGIWKLPPTLEFDLSQFKQALHEHGKPSRAGKVMLRSNGNKQK